MYAWRHASGLTVLERDLMKLLGHAREETDKRARECALIAMRSAFEAADPRSMLSLSVKFSDNRLVVKGAIFDLTHFSKIIVVGAGKASGRMAEFIEDLLGERIDKGLVVVPQGTRQLFQLNRIEVAEAGHPIPDNEGLEAARRTLDIVSSGDSRNLVICLFSGGASSLLPLPIPGLSLQDKIDVTRILLRSGANIDELNTVRKHLSSIKGGRLARAAYPSAVIGVLISDVVGDDMGTIASGPTAPDTTTYQDAMGILKGKGLWDLVPCACRDALIRGASGSSPETPKPNDRIFARVNNFVVGNNELACKAAVERLLGMGLQASHVTSRLTGEARDVGRSVVGTLRDMAVAVPRAFVFGGETTVTVKGDGRGGRNQELCLSAALDISGIKGIALLSVGTDGIDGITDAAGAIADGESIARGSSLGLNPFEYLEKNDSYDFFKALDDLIVTGPTGTNVNDIVVFVFVPRVTAEGKTHQT